MTAARIGEAENGGFESVFLGEDSERVIEEGESFATLTCPDARAALGDPLCNAGATGRTTVPIWRPSVQVEAMHAKTTV